MKVSIENNIYFIGFPSNATHLLQPLNVGIFVPVKKYWRKVLDKLRQESRHKKNYGMLYFLKLRLSCKML